MSGFTRACRGDWWSSTDLPPIGPRLERKSSKKSSLCCSSWRKSIYGSLAMSEILFEHLGIDKSKTPKATAKLFRSALQPYIGRSVDNQTLDDSAKLQERIIETQSARDRFALKLTGPISRGDINTVERHIEVSVKLNLKANSAKGHSESIWN